MLCCHFSPGLLAVLERPALPCAVGRAHLGPARPESPALNLTGPDTATGPLNTLALSPLSEFRLFSLTGL